jgi:plasmid rolling circle replication initiator protein Rep
LKLFSKVKALVKVGNTTSPPTTRSLEMPKYSGPQDYLTDFSEKDKPWDSHRATAETVQRLYESGDYLNYAQRIEDCSRRLQFALLPDEQGEVVFKLQAARFCRVRFCPVCQWRRALMWRARFYKALPQFIAAHPKLRPIFLTLTVRNCPVSELRSQLNEMNRAFSKMTRRKAWPGVAWVKSVEVTRNPQTDEAHPHFHVLLFAEPGYFKGQRYLSQARWRELWQACLKVDYLPVVNVKAVKPRSGSKQSQDDAMRLAIIETLKYGVKPSDLISEAQWLYQVTQQLHKTRSVAVGGLLKGYLQEDEPEDLIHDDEAEEALPDEALHLYFDWLQLVKRYAKVDPQA